MQLQLEENKSNASRTLELEQEVKEKNLLIGKLRHEGVYTVCAIFCITRANLARQPSS